MVVWPTSSQVQIRLRRLRHDGLGGGPRFPQVLDSAIANLDKAGVKKKPLRRRAALLNPSALKRGMDEARDRLLKLSVTESGIPSCKVS